MDRPVPAAARSAVTAGRAAVHPGPRNGGDEQPATPWPRRLFARRRCSGGFTPGGANCIGTGRRPGPAKRRPGPRSSAQVTVTNNSAPPAALNSGAWQAVEPATRFGSRRALLINRARDDARSRFALGRGRVQPSQTVTGVGDEG